ncbi:hypothetical protein [Synechococcus elongatus]|uniref:Uncharacterized protein n=2 Tax=Synechococcus elongatus TaxID=32046 RepID=Q31QW5_SYNE7|nr:hypothetical protein [Synechococcus elongatus]AJD56404.1 hypothetical protein M744_00345 [Synechococcus elongatus UTEX 2973]UOW70312.1 hypothetical protein PCC7943_0539 [Synechococcus elongatus PCC 7943]UOW73033.1 hypothetical protein PCC6311_0539 [Synechococcus elongatus PCC 6311]ABB56554.1 hypothetical protein Synpcc7942_0522 [Synechococcus elongatus PCC 7942 = FACHB-805]MBD2689930.1 hypothetical protein [Synechococcus elongatus FACHB-1061]
MQKSNWLMQSMASGLLGLGLATAFALPGSATPARCVIQEAGRTTFNGACDFKQFGQNGSFTVTSLQSNWIAGRSVITVTVLSPGVAEVRGLTPEGINSRWGIAERSSRDRACWVGDDFRVCAY